MSIPAAEPRSRRRTLLFVLALLFFAPVAVSFYLYYGLPEWRPRANVSHGDLITPARPLPQAALMTPEGKQTPPTVLQEKWSLAFIGNGSCDAVCRQALRDIRQIHISLGREMERVQRVFIYTGLCCEQPFFRNEHSGLIAVSADTEQGAALLERFPTYGGVPVDEAGRLYIIDPLGNLMMSYPPQVNPKGLREDLKKLLKLSHIG